MIVYTVTIDYFYDDYKRAEGSSEVEGVYTDKNIAMKTLIKTEYEKNVELISEEVEITEEDDDYERYKKYTEKYNEFMSLDIISDEQLEKWKEATKTFLGEPEFTTRATGYYGNVQEMTVQ